MRTFLKIVIFSLAVTGVYAFFANIVIPQVRPAPPPVEEKLDLGSMTMEQFVGLGEKVFNDICTLCHNPVGGRAPLMIQAGKDGPPIGARAEERVKDPRYKGKAKNGEEYIRESENFPSAFVVPGYGVKGTNDTVSPMPVTTSGAIGLTDAKVDAVIAYFQTNAGVPVTVKIPTGGAPAPAGTEAAAPPAAPAKTPEEFVAKYGCGVCHKVAGQQGPICPDLMHIGTVAMTRIKDKDYKGKAKDAAGYITESILNPSAFVAPGFPPGVMPPDFGAKILAQEFNMMVNFLSNSK